ncbi:aldo/keto reductase [Candidatus Woesearchaeota archaeon]|nr:aldo/keto reductase [Candidatus Woesearchaeota archaeon]
MKYVTLGKTGLTVSRIGFGGVSLGGQYGPHSREQNRAAVKKAFELGVTLFDTSPYYGVPPTRAEVELGNALQGIPRKDFTLSTKTGRFGDEWFDFSGERVRGSVYESMSRLKVDYLDIVFIHDYEFEPEPQRILDETIPALVELKKAGAIGHIGISGFPLKIFPFILGQTEQISVVLTYAQHTLQNDSVRGLLPYLNQQRVGIIGGSPTGLGLLTPHGPRPWHPATEEIKARCAALRGHFGIEGKDLAELAMQYAFSIDGIHTILMGTNDIGEVERNIAAFDKPIDSASLEKALEILKPVHNLSWKSGLERWQGPVEERPGLN